MSRAARGRRVRKDTGGKTGINVRRSAGRPQTPRVGDSIDTADRIRGRVEAVRRNVVIGKFVRNGQEFRVKAEHTVFTKELPKGRKQFWAPNSSKIAVGADDTSADVAQDKGAEQQEEVRM